MIRINNKVGSVAPAVLVNKGAIKTETYKTEFDNGETKFKFDRRIYANTTVKKALSILQHGKCCFCESCFEHVGFGDVEHIALKEAGFKTKNH